MQTRLPFNIRSGKRIDNDLVHACGDRTHSCTLMYVIAYHIHSVAMVAGNTNVMCRVCKGPEPQLGKVARHLHVRQLFGQMPRAIMVWHTQSIHTHVVTYHIHSVAMVAVNTHVAGKVHNEPTPQLGEVPLQHFEWEHPPWPFSKEVHEENRH